MGTPFLDQLGDADSRPLIKHLSRVPFTRFADSGLFHAPVLAFCFRALVHNDRCVAMIISYIYICRVVVDARSAQVSPVRPPPPPSSVKEIHSLPRLPVPLHWQSTPLNCVPSESLPQCLPTSFPFPIESLPPGCSHQHRAGQRTVSRRGLPPRPKS